jgi:hypothetical protein
MRDDVPGSRSFTGAGLVTLYPTSIKITKCP